MNVITSLGRWLSVLFSGAPHFYIGGKQRPYLLRWYLIPRNGFLNIYLHKFLRDDDDRALHDHPWWFISFVLKGGYLEHIDSGKGIVRKRWSLAFRKAEHRHRVELLPDKSGDSIPCWTLIVTGPKRREWGFWCPRGFVPWHQFVAPHDKGDVGRGCE